VQPLERKDRHMLLIIFCASMLVAITVVVHVFGLTFLLKHLSRRHGLLPTGFWPTSGLLISLTWWLLVIHLLEIAIWGLFYTRAECLPDAETAFYFSGVTYATIGYGEVVLTKPWRMLGPIEGLTGILMCGLSTGFYFVIVNRIYQSRSAEGIYAEPKEPTA
jgi:Ion channel